MSRIFELALNKEGQPQFSEAKLPEYQTLQSAGADFFCAEDVVIPSSLKHILRRKLIEITPTMIHTGIKANMEPDEGLFLFNRSSNPKKKGMILSNGVGVVDADYYGNESNDGEIMFPFYNFHPWDVKIKAGEAIGQGVFLKYLRPENAKVKDTKRMGGFGSTDKK